MVETPRTNSVPLFLLPPLFPYSQITHMSWITEISYKSAQGRLKKLYDRVKGPEDNVDNIMMAHSLRPHSMIGHMTLYKNVLHHSANELPKWYLELVGVYVSHLNTCKYCVIHHANGLKRLLGDDEKFQRILKEIEMDHLRESIDADYIVGTHYAKILTLNASAVTEQNIQRLREHHFTDGQILELNQVVSYFNYANRMVLGLGINIDGDILGLSPNDDQNEDNWGHK